MILEEALKLYPDMKRLVVKGLDGRIKVIYNKEEVPLNLLPEHIYDIHLTYFGDLDVKMKV